MTVLDAADMGDDPCRENREQRLSEARSARLNRLDEGYAGRHRAGVRDDGRIKASGLQVRGELGGGLPIAPRRIGIAAAS